MWFFNHHTVQFVNSDFLDVAFNLDKNAYKSSHKENIQPTYLYIYIPTAHTTIVFCPQNSSSLDAIAV